jgi:hypothetical protein
LKLHIVIKNFGTSKKKDKNSMRKSRCYRKQLNAKDKENKDFKKIME